MTPVLERLLAQDAINFTLTNRIPRRWLTRVVGRVSRIEHPVVCRLSLAVWQRFSGDLHLEEAATTHFPSLHACFTRALRPGARTVDPDPGALVSPCDGIVGACGRIQQGQLFQAKGARYTLEDLLGGGDASLFEGGAYVTLRLTSSMYHRFHAPADLRLRSTTFIPGELWNVNPVSVRRIPRLYCRNERAVLRATTASELNLVLVAVGAVLVGSIHVHAVGTPLNQEYGGPYHLPCAAPAVKGDELGFFHHGSTIIVIADRRARLADGISTGVTVRMGQALLREDRREQDHVGDPDDSRRM